MDYQIIVISEMRHDASGNAVKGSPCVTNHELPLFF